MSSNMYTEYVFGRPELDHATKDLQAISFNVAVHNQALLKMIRSYDFSKNSEEIRNTVRQLQKQVEAKIKIFLDKSFDLSELLKELDSYYAVFQELVNKSMKELIANNELSNSMNNVNTIPITSQNIMAKQDVQYLVDPKTNQLFLLDPTTGETQYVNSPIQGSGLNIEPINEMNNFVASQEDAQSNLASQSVTQTGDVFEYKPVVSAIEATTDVPKIENGSEIILEAPAVDNVPEIISEEPVVNDGSEIISEAPAVDNVPKIISEAPVASEEPVITSSTSVSNEAASEEDKSLEKVKSSKGVGETATPSEKPEEEFVAYDDARSTINNNEQAKSENTEEAAKAVEEVTTPPVEETSKEESPVSEKSEDSKDKTKDEFVTYDDTISTVKPNEQSKSENTEEAAKAVEEVTTPPVEETSKEESPVSEKSEDSEDKTKDEFVTYDDTKSTVKPNEQSESENPDEAAKAVEEVTTPPVEETSKEESGAIIEPVIVNESPEVNINEVKEISPVDIKTTPLIPTVDVVKPVGTVDSVDTVSTIGTVDTVPNVDDIIPLLPEPIGLSSSKDNSQDVIKENDDSNKIITDNSNNAKILEFPKVIEDSNKTTTDSSNNAKILEFPEVSEDSNKTTIDSSNKAEILEFHKKSGDSTKAIITSDRQISKLRKSLKTQQALLNARGFFNLNAKEQDIDDSIIDFNSGDIKSILETMLEKANKLYKDGKVDEAQKMYEKISEMNRQRQATEEEESNGYAYQLAA